MRERSDAKLGKSYAIDFVPGTDLIVCLGQKVKLRRRLGRERLQEALPFSHPADCAVAPDGLSVAVRSTSGAMAVLDLPTLQARWVLPPSTEGCQLLYSACGTQLITGTWQGELLSVDSNSGAIRVISRASGSMFRWLSQSADRQTFAYARQPIAVGDLPPGDSVVAIRRWPLEAHAEQRVEGPWRYVWAAAISPDARRLAVLHKREGLQMQIDVLELNKPQIVSSTPFLYGGTNLSLDWSPDGRHLACIHKDEAAVMETGGLSVVGRVPLSYPCHVKFSPDGSLLAVGSWQQGTVKRLEDVLDRSGESLKA